MSQDHSRQDRERLVEDLLRKEDALSVQMAEEMKRNVKTKQNNQEQLINGVLWIVHGEFTFRIVLRNLRFNTYWT
ncbi:hypothetical protein [Dyadobacter chenhuakuii]|uniref:Uncharacterized protein n=1 Tax=Dyadobacter chenhuakuii TaxID=2909339 RepID=A0ABY4XL69_9BACT|nr:hypothetical protein [Dyadobacter chenhuakuii]MCF2494051.1 hypothetical protein [Dyadobacter chenhuakuii]USJ31180.1 hypothetical protein NFI80_00260 [Dyadobacter chenhuakuii]